MYVALLGTYSGEPTVLLAVVGETLPAKFTATKILATNESIVGLAEATAAALA